MENGDELMTMFSYVLVLGVESEMNTVTGFMVNYPNIGSTVISPNS